MNTVKEKIDIVKKSVFLTEYGISSLCRDIFFLNGMSSPKVRTLLNNLGSFSKRYCEVGSWRGSTLISACYNNNLEYALAIDDFSQFSDEQIFCVNPLIELLPPNQQKEFLYESHPKDELIEKTLRFNISCDILEGSFNGENARKHLDKLDHKFDLYLYDGEHSYQSQYNGIYDMITYMDDTFILCVDDWTMDEKSEVRTGTFDAIKDLGVKLHAHWSGFSRGNGDIENYWNGFFVGVIEK